jgi:hypothetical protein
LYNSTFSMDRVDLIMYLYNYIWYNSTFLVDRVDLIKNTDHIWAQDFRTCGLMTP